MGDKKLAGRLGAGEVKGAKEREEAEGAGKAEEANSNSPYIAIQTKPRENVAFVARQSHDRNDGLGH